MKKIFPLILVPLLSLFSLPAQITQVEADEIIIKRLCSKTSDFIIYVKENVQTGFEVTTATGEVLELDYPCWVYYANITNETDNKYLFVKETNGNLLEITTRNDEVPDDLATWRKIVEYSCHLQGTKWKLEGIVDTETNSLKILEPQDCEQCYMLWFDTDSTASGTTAGNYLLLRLRPMPIFGIVTSAGEFGDGMLFREVISSIDSYKLDLGENELSFYYDNRKKSLLYKQILP